MNQRIAIIGSTGAGKTTLSRQIAQQSELIAIDLDWLYWKPAWTAESIESFRASVSIALAAPKWAASGNYPRARDIIWGRADTLVWLDYPLMLSTYRLIKRSLSGLVSGNEVLPGCRETLQNTFLKRDSVLWYGLRTYRRRRDEIARDLQNDYQHLQVMHFRNPGETAKWLKESFQR